MAFDPDSYVADVFPGMVGDLQTRAIAEAEKAYLDERAKAKALREQAKLGMNTSELVADLYGTEEQEQKRIDAEIERVNKEAAAAAAAQKEKDHERATEAKFPAPVITVT